MKKHSIVKLYEVGGQPAAPANMKATDLKGLRAQNPAAADAWDSLVDSGRSWDDSPWSGTDSDTKFGGAEVPFYPFEDAVYAFKPKSNGIAAIAYMWSNAEGKWEEISEFKVPLQIRRIAK